MKTKTLLTLTTVVALTWGFTGCASTAENMRAQGYGPEYSQGYGDGCDSGKKAGGSLFDQFKKDVNHYDNSHKYREGWNDGYRQCKSEEKQLEQSIENSSRDAAIRDSYDSPQRGLDYAAQDAMYDASSTLSAQDIKNINNLR